MHSIIEFAFADCSALTDVFYDTSNPISANQNIFDDSSYSKAVLHISAAGLAKAKAIAPWMYFKNIDDKTARISKIENLDKGSTIDFDKPYEVYDFSGIFVGVSNDNLDHGIYIIRQDSRVTKIVIK